MHDLKLTYYCDKTWDITATLNPTVYSKTKVEQGAEDLDSWAAFAGRLVDPLTCKLNNTKAELTFETDEERAEFLK